MADKPTTQATDTPKASLFPESTEKVVAASPVGTEEPKKESPALPKTKPTMVIDANVLIKSADLQALAQKYSLATVAQAVKEVRDPNARMRLGTIMGDLKIMIPGKEHLAKVSEFAKKTGDCVSISVTDAHLIALALMLIEQKGNSHMVRSEPARAENFGGDPAQETAEGTLNGDEGNSDEEESIPETAGNTATQTSQGETTPSESTGKPAEEEVDPDEEYQRVDEDDGWMVASGPQKKKPESGKRERKQTEESISSDSKTFTSKALTPVVKSPHPEEKGELAPQLWYEDKDFEQEDEDGWITPQNLKDVVQGSEVVEVSQLESIGVGVMTADFAMQDCEECGNQNLILQMGVPLLSVEGMIIKKIKSYVLECFTCLNICRDNSKQFCPSCGHNSLLRVTCSFNKDGSFILYRRKDFKYAIPRPKGGQNSEDLIISQDDLNRIQHRMKYHSKPNTHESQMRAAEEAYEHAYGLDGANKISRPVNLKPGYGRNNPNDNGFRKKISSKRG